jgi:hypothetical protein
LFHVRIDKRVGKASGTPVAGFAQWRVCIVGNFIRVAHKENGAHILSVRTMN